MGTSPARRARLRARRQELAARAAEVVRLRRAAGHSCTDCRHRTRRQDKTACSLGDDGPWYQPVALDHLCWQWEAKP